MKKRQKIHSLIIIFAIIFSTLVFAGVETFAAATAVPTVSTVSTAPIAPASVAAPAIQGDKPKQDIKIPSTPQKNAYAEDNTEKTGFKYAFFKFLLAMLGVLLSSGAIFAGLKIYKKLVLKNDAKLNQIDYDKTLESPKDFKEAINLFLHKTNKR